MMSTKICSLLVACLLTPACVVGEAPGGDATCTEGKCDGTGGGACSDKRYGDGTCDTELECAAPDIDCFLTFENDQTAATWYGGLEEQIAASEAREPRAILGDSDPRFARARDLLDRGWKAFRDQRPVGKLFGLRPGLVIVEDDEANAFVITDFADTNKAGFAVMVHTGFLDSRSDDQTLGVMMHEFQHAIGLHVIDGVSDRLRKFYVASPNNEPLGYEATENAQARTYGETWRLFASEVGPYSTAVLGGFPTDGDIKRAFDHVRRMGSAANPTACQNAQTLGMA
ncbi:MAG: M48 family metalloprotease, partial [Kofleriaceae bacterium]